MNLDITFGQYCEGDSVIHRMDPRAKIIAVLLYIVVIFLAKSFAAFGLLTAAAVVLVLLSGIRPRIILHGLKPLMFILLFTCFPSSLLLTNGFARALRRSRG